MRRLWGIGLLTLALAVTGCGGAKTTVQDTPAAAAAEVASVAVPDVVGQTGDIAQDTLEAAGFDVSWGGETVFKPSNWTVDAQSPVAGVEMPAGTEVVLIVSKPEPTAAPVDTTLDDITAAQFLATAWEKQLPYGGSVHWIVDRITTANPDGSFTFKIGTTVKTESGTDVEATIEGDVAGTKAAPVITDSILYLPDGTVIDLPQ